MSGLWHSLQSTQFLFDCFMGRHFLSFSEAFICSAKSLIIIHSLFMFCNNSSVLCALVLNVVCRLGVLFELCFISDLLHLGLGQSYRYTLNYLFKWSLDLFKCKEQCTLLHASN